MRSWIPWLVFGPLILLLGIAIGSWLRPDRLPWSDVHAAMAPDGDARTSAPVANTTMPSFAPIVAAARDAVVGIRTIHLDDAPPPIEGAEPAADTTGYGVSSGTGFVIREDGLILTARHLVTRPNTIVVEIPERGAVEGELAGEDPHSDLALVRLLDPPPDLHVLPLGDSDVLRQGDWVVTLGNPLRYRQSVGAGVVSYVGRHLAQDGMLVTSDHLQFTAPANPGSSGSPVFAVDGQVVGITTRAVVDGQGLTFATPARVIKQVLAAMHRNSGRARRAYLGIRFQDLERDAAARYGLATRGVRVTEVFPGQPADLAGIRRGDVLLSFGGRAVSDALELHERITWSEPGEATDVELLRDGVRIAVEPTLHELDSGAPPRPANQ